MHFAAKAAFLGVQHSTRTELMLSWHLEVVEGSSQLLIGFASAETLL